MAWLNAVADRNRWFIFVTSAVFHMPFAALIVPSSLNKPLIPMIADTSHADMCPCAAFQSS